MSGFLTTHVLDTARGLPARGMQVVLFRLSPAREEIARMVTNDDGRTDAHILPAGDFATGTYELEFHAGAWMDASGVAPESPRFLDVIRSASACRRTTITTCRCWSLRSAIPPIGAAEMIPEIAILWEFLSLPSAGCT